LTNSDEQLCVGLDWPTRFRDAYGRAPRVLHIGNVANYAWTNAVMMARCGVDCTLLDPDNYHIVSAPEWVEADVVGDPGDPFHPRWSQLDSGAFQRPEWLLNGPTPFVLRELAARERGQHARRASYRWLSQVYRRGLASDEARPSSFRRVMEARGSTAVALKTLARRLSLGRSGGASGGPGSIPSGEPTELAVPADLPADVLSAALEPFDIVVGYALGARFALAQGHPRFASLEIGTIRGLVFESTPLGRLAADIYRRSPVVFVTNVDVLGEAARLGIAADRLVPIPHPFDLERVGAPPDLLHDDGPPVLFAPARHHWQSGNASWLKGNNVLIEGAALLARQGGAFRLRFVRWGPDVAASEALLAECGLADRVEWLEPMPRPRLWSEIAGAAAVVDQFAASAFGGAALETMGLGRRIISRLDQPELAPFFGSRPPILDARTSGEVCQRMRAVLDDPRDRSGIGAAGRRWMEAEHGPEQQIGRQFAAFAALVAAHGHATYRPAASSLT
jgi:glycosyltransferase involved in cell wall biosynthesis